MIACQISFYPLKSENIVTGVDEVLKIIHSFDLEVQTNEMSTIVAGDAGSVYKMLSEITDTMQQKEMEFVMNITITTSCGVSVKQNQ